MDKQLLYQSIENVDTERGLSTRELESIAAEYPWFSTAQLLLSKRYHHQRDHRFSDQLFHTALVAGDRDVLYRLIHRESTFSRDIDTTAPVLAAEPEVAKPIAEVAAFTLPLPAPNDGQRVSLKFKEIPAPLADASALAKTILDDEGTAPQTPVQPVEAQIVHAPQPAAAIPEEEVAEAQAPELLPLLKRAHVINDEPVEKEKEEEETPESETSLRAEALDPLQREILVEAVSSTIELEVGEDVGIASEEEETQPDDSYAAWLAKRARAIGFGMSEEERELERGLETESESEEESEKESESESEATPSRPAAKLTPRKTHQQELIDRFIRFEPKIAPGKAAEYQPGNLAKESLEEDFSIVTETMAILFAKQGKLDKARKVYKQLMAEHPEKSVYFAAQLKNLDKYKKP